MKTLDVGSLDRRDTDKGRDIAGFGQKPIWKVDGVVIAYGGDDPIVDVFDCTLKDTKEGYILTAKGAAKLQFFVDESWVDDAPFEDYEGEHDDKPKAGLGGTIVAQNTNKQQATSAAYEDELTDTNQ